MDSAINSNKKEEKASKKIVFLVLFIYLIFAIFYVVVVRTPQQNQSPKYQTLKPQKVTPTIVQNGEVTGSTKTAYSLDAPVLYPNATWEVLAGTAKEQCINDQSIEIEKNNDILSFPVHSGSCWQAVVPLSEESNFYEVEQYYANELARLGWEVSKEHNTKYGVQFKEVRIMGEFADSPCNGILGYVGYKDGFVRLLSIRHEYIGCGSPMSNSKITGVRDTVFVSDPIPLKEIVEFTK